MVKGPTVACVLQAQENKLAGLASQMLRLRASGASPRRREGLIMKTMAAINEIRHTTPHVSRSVCNSSLHPLCQACLL